MAHSVLITLHAAAGVVAFVLGIAAVTGGRFLRAYRWSLVASIALLGAAVGADAAGRDAASWAIFGGLFALGVVMVVRAFRAGSAGTAAYVHHVGFGIVGLLDAFWVVTLVRAGWPGWALGVVGVGIALVGHAVLARVARARRPADSMITVG